VYQVMGKRTPKERKVYKLKSDVYSHSLYVNWKGYKVSSRTSELEQWLPPKWWTIYIEEQLSELRWLGAPQVQSGKGEANLRGMPRPTPQQRVPTHAHQTRAAGEEEKAGGRPKDEGQ